MSTKAQRKERQRLKRKTKAQQRRREQSVSVYRQLAQHGAIQAAYINADWREGGFGSILTVVRGPDGTHTIVEFLIDFWCAGLKDCSGQFKIPRHEFEQEILPTLARKRDVALERIEPSVAQRLVKAAIRFASQNGFRLPKKYERWASAIDACNDWQHADLSDFGIDGGLRWIGSLDELRQRLLYGNVDEFLSRPNVHFIAPVSPFEFADLDEDDDDDDDDDFDDEELEEVIEEISPTVMGVEAAVRRWCSETGQFPERHLTEAIVWLVALLAQSLDEEGAEEGLAFPPSLPPDPDLIPATRQAQHFMAHFETPMAMMKYVDSTTVQSGSSEIADQLPDEDASA